MSLLPVKTCTCTQDKKQTAGTDYDGQSLCSSGSAWKVDISFLVSLLLLLLLLLFK